ncbi:MAG: hypothetical protein QXI33_01890 [Candidatus Pacearchaeota archaeon]
MVKINKFEDGLDELDGGLLSEDDDDIGEFPVDIDEDGWDD